MGDYERELENTARWVNRNMEDLINKMCEVSQFDPPYCYVPGKIRKIPIWERIADRLNEVRLVLIGKKIAVYPEDLEQW